MTRARILLNTGGSNEVGSTNPIMKKLTALLVTSAISGTLHAQVLFEESFDSQASAKVQVDQTTDAHVQFVDYSSFMLGATTHTIPEAPNMVSGSTATQGVIIRANLTEGSPQIGNLTALNEADERLEFTGNLKLSYDLYLSLSQAALDADNATEVAIWGLGHDGSVPLGRSNRNSGTLGTWGWIAGDAGFGTEDCSIWLDGTNLATLNNTTTGAAEFSAAFPNGGPSFPAPNNTWVHVEVVALDGQVTVSYNGVEFVSGASTSTDGFAVIGYEDPFGSISAGPDFQFALFDNFKVEVAKAPTIIATQEVTFLPLNADGGTSTGSFTVENKQAVPLNITEIKITGEDSAAFVLDTALPIVIPGNSSETFAVTFTAGEGFGLKTADLEIVSDDVTSPSLSLSLNAIFAAPLLAHYKLDEENGDAIIESSGNGPDGTFTVTDPLVYSGTGLAGGTSIGFTAAQFPPAGNFGQMNPLHVPTTSISLWIKPDGGDGGEDTLFNRDPGFTGADAIYGCYIDEGGALNFRSGGTDNLASAPGAIVDGQTYHVVITHLDEDGFGNSTAARSRMYIDGALVAENTSPTGFDAYPPGSSTSSLYLASRSAAGDGFDGLIDDLQVYSIELTAEQVVNMFNAPGITAFENVPEMTITDFNYDPATLKGTIVFTSVPNRLYVIEQTGDLIDWGELEDSVESDGFSTTFEFTATPENGNARFYRVAPEN